MKKYLLLLFLLFVASLNFNLILKPLLLTTGGNQGLAIILSNVFNFSPSSIIFIINLISLLLSYIFLTKEITIGAVISSFIYPLFVKLTSSFNLFKVSSYPILFVILSGIICGLTCGYIYKLGFSQGGINIISLIIKKYFKIKIILSNFIMNVIILFLGILYFGLLKGFYSFIVIIINSYLIKLILGKNNKNKVYRIILY